MGIVMILYVLWGWYAGYHFLTGRSEWLDRDAPLNKIVKMGASVAVGYVIGAFYLIYLVWKFLIRKGA